MTRHAISTIMGVCALGLVLAASPAQADVGSGFDLDNQGWVVVSYPFRGAAVGLPTTSTLPFDATFGLPPGSVRVADVYGETGIAAPGGFLGDRQAYYGGQLSYDIFLRFTDNVDYPAVVLVGATMSLYFDAPSPPVGAWDHRVVPMVETGWKVGGSQANVSQADFLAVLQDLRGLYLYTEWHSGADDTNVDNVALRGTGAAVGEVAGARLAARCYPNPFNPRTTVSFDLPGTGQAVLSVYDVAGRLVRTLVDESLTSGRHDAVWDGLDEGGRAAGSGSYLARLVFGGQVATVRLGLVR